MNKVPVSKRAVTQRVGRCLKKLGLSLHKTRSGTEARDSVGEFCLVDDKKGLLSEHGTTLEGLVSQFNVLKPWEVLSD